MIDASSGGANVKSGFESAITENSERSVTFTTAFSSTPDVVVGLADSSDEISVLSAHTVSANGFTIKVNKSGGGASADRDVYWIATDAGDS
jgi:hypothetical protein